MYYLPGIDVMWRITYVMSGWSTSSKSVIYVFKFKICGTTTKFIQSPTFQKRLLCLLIGMYARMNASHVFIVIEDAGNKALALVNMPMFCDMYFPYIFFLYYK